MSRADLPSGRSNSVQTTSTQRDYSAPVVLIAEAEPEPCFDTALPPMSSKQLVVAARRPPGGLETSLLASRIVYNQQSPTVSGGLSGHRRTGSTLKTVMRKIFTRKRRSQTDNVDDHVPEFRFSTVAPRSDSNGNKSSGIPKSTSSQGTSPIRQNHEELTTLDVVLEKLGPQPRQRRATLPSLIFSDDESRHALEAIVHSDKAQINRGPSPHASSDPEEAQRLERRKMKRRSRSAGALRSMTKDHRMSPIQWRRPSIESDSLVSTAYGVASDSELSYRPPTRTTIASVSKPSAEISVFEEEEEDTAADEESILPNVGEIINSMQQDESASLEQRLTTLEVKLIDLEFAIARMQSGRGETPTDAPNQKTPSPGTSRHKRNESSSYFPPSNNVEGRPSTEPVSGVDRPLSTSTIRPSPSDIYRARALQAPSMTSLSDSSTISVQQYSALVMLLRREQTARRNLEQQVTGLREDIERLQRMAHDSIGIGTMYPIRSPDSQEFLRMRQDSTGSPSSSPIRTKEKFSSRYESDSDRDRSEMRSKDDVFRRRWQQPTRHVEVANMI